MNWEVGTNTCILLLLCITQVTPENLLDSRGDSPGCSAVTRMGRKSGKEGMCVQLVRFAVQQ